MNPYNYTEERYNNYLRSCILNISKTSQKHFTNESFNDNSSEYLQSIHLEIKTLLNSLESLFSHHKYELINNTNFNLINYGGSSKDTDSNDTHSTKNKNIMDFMSSIISSTANSDSSQNGEEDDDDENNVSHNNYLFSNVASFHEGMPDIDGSDESDNDETPNMFTEAYESDNDESASDSDNDSEPTMGLPGNLNYNMVSNDTDEVDSTNISSDGGDNNSDGGSDSDGGDEDVISASKLPVNYRKKELTLQKVNPATLKLNLKNETSNNTKKNQCLDETIKNQNHVDNGVEDVEDTEEDEENQENQVLYNGKCTARVNKKKELANSDTPDYYYKDENGFTYGSQCTNEKIDGELVCQKHKSKMKDKKFSHIFNPPYFKLTIINPTDSFDKKTVTLQKILYGENKYYLNPETNDIYDYETRIIIGKKISDNEIIFDDGEEH